MPDSSLGSTPSTLASRMQHIVAEFSHDADWEARYRRVIEKGKKLAELPEQFRDEKYKVKGCQSQVWLHAELSSEGRLVLFADSDALIVRGLVACLLEVYSGAKPEEVLASRPTFLADIGFASNLTPSRANGLNAMVRQIYMYATVFASLNV